MKAFFKHIIYFLIVLFSLQSFSQETTKEKVKRLTNAVDSIETKGEKHFFSILNPILNSPKNRAEKLNAMYFYGRYYMYNEKPDSILYYAKHLVELTKPHSDSLSYSMLTRAYLLLGTGYRTKGLHEIGKEYNLKGIELYNKGIVKEEHPYAYHMRGLASSYDDEKEYDKALELYNKCLKLNINQHMLYACNNDIGVVYGKIKQYRKSIEYFKKAYSLCSGSSNTNKCKAYMLSNIGSSYNEMGILDSALVYYDKAIESIKKYKTGDSGFMVISGANLGEIYHKKKLYDLAIAKYEVSLRQSREYGYVELEKIILEYIKKSTEEKGDYKTALLYETQRLNLIDSLHRAQKKQEVSELEVKYNTLQKEKEIELLRKDQELYDENLSKEKKIELILVISFLAILIPVIGLLFMYYQKSVAQKQLNKKQEEITRQRISKLMVDQELQVMKASIEGQDNERERIAQELHDSIGGNLAALKLQFSSISNGKKVFKTINKQIDDTYNQVRTISHNLTPKKFKQNPFMSVIRDYMKNIGDASNLKIICNAFPIDEINNIDEKIQLEIFKILQELITNTVKHANASEVDIQINNVEDSINILFEDNGVGFNTHNRSDGIGIKNVESRIESFGGTLNIDSRKNRGTIVNIEIPLNLLNDEV